MAKTTAKLLGLALAGAGAYGLWTAGQALLGDDESTGTSYVTNQVWIDRLPEGPRDMIGHLAMVRLPQGRFGGAGRSSQWRHVVEMFQWSLEGQRLALYFPQDEVKAKLTVRTWECEDEAPAPFELCMEISNGRRSATFYSRHEWHIEPKDAEGSLEALAAEYPALRSAIAEVSVPTPLSDEELDGFAPGHALDALFAQ